MTTRRDPLAEAFREALESEAPGAADVGPDDDALLARAIDRAMAGAVAPAAPAIDPSVAALPAASAGSSAPSSGPSAGDPASSLRALRVVRQPRARAVRYALPAAAALVASIAMGAVYTHYRSVPRPSNDVTHDPRVSALPVATGAVPPAPIATPPVDVAPTVSVDDLPSVAPRGPGSAPRDDRARVAIPSTATAAELFRDANGARRAGDVDAAVELYGALIARHGATAEADAARVSLGRLLLDRRGDVAGALAQFDAYLGSPSSDRALAEEARMGRALVFQRQGRHEQERRAWLELLEKHPDSLYAERARERLRALAPAESAPSAPSPSP